MSTCKYCREPIGWMREGSSWIPMDGALPHQCKARRVPEVIPCAPIVGPLYKPSCGKCATPPWEICACSALMGRAA